MNIVSTLAGWLVPPSKATVRNLGLSLDTHIESVLMFAFDHLRDIAKVRHFLSQRDAESLIHEFISSRLDYCNSLLSGCPHKSLKLKALPECSYSGAD